MRVRRRDKKRWGSRTRWYRLWALAKQAPPLTPEQQISQSLNNFFTMKRELEQLLDTSNITSSKEAERSLKALKNWAEAKARVALQPRASYCVRDAR